jgi:hypothetical protein
MAEDNENGNSSNSNDKTTAKASGGLHRLGGAIGEHTSGIRSKLASIGSNVSIEQKKTNMIKRDVEVVSQTLQKIFQRCC